MPKLRLLEEVPQNNKNELYTLFYVQDEQTDQIYHAKIFSISKLQEYHLDEALEYNEEVLSDMECMAFPQNINQINLSVPNEGIFTFITEPYETNLMDYMRLNKINQQEALSIFDHVVKAIYSVYAAGYWHKSIRPQHFVKVGNLWKLDSLVYLEENSNSRDLFSEYLWDHSYQPPQCYQKEMSKFTDDDFLLIVVWNLGSLLLDLFFSVHKLKNYQILQLYKGKKFTLENIKVKKTDLFSKKIQNILSSMLHYEPKSRMRLEEVFSNDYLSRQVAMLFKQKHKNSLKGAPIKIFTGGKSALSSALRSREERQKGDKVLPLNQLVKSAINDLEGGLHKLIDRRNAKSMEMETDTESGEKASMADILDRFLPKRNQSSKRIQNANQSNSIQSLSSKNEFSSVIRIYQTMMDKSEILSISGGKFQEIQFKEYKKQTSLVSQYTVELLGYLNLRLIEENLSKKVNFLSFDEGIFEKFKESREHEGLKVIVREKMNQTKEKIIKIRRLVKELAEEQRKLSQQQQIKHFLWRDMKSIQFSEIKVAYRKVLKIGYDFVTKEYNKQLNSQKLARLAMHIVYCLTIDKLYLPNLMDKNFLSFFQWYKQKPTPYIPCKKFIKYVNEANPNILVAHAKELLERFFKI